MTNTSYGLCRQRQDRRKQRVRMAENRCAILSLIPLRAVILLKFIILLLVIMILLKSMPQPVARSWSRASIAQAYRNILAGQRQGYMVMHRDHYHRMRRNRTQRVEIEPSEDVLQAPETFQQVNHNEAWLYSAFYDIDVTAPGQELVRVFGISTYSRYKVLCFLTEDGLTDLVRGRREFISDNHLQNNSAMMIFCPLKTGSRPQFVSIVFDKKDKPTNNLTIEYPKRKQRDLTVCHSIIYNLTDHRQLVQSIEMNRVLGVEHFYVYNHSATQKADRALRHYQRMGLLTVMRWPVPTQHVWYLGQNMAINDCVYRNKGLSTYVAILDTDEVVVPRHHRTIVEVLEAIDHEVKAESKLRRKQIVVGSYVFQTSIFTKIPPNAQWEKIKSKFFITPEEESFIRENSVVYLAWLLRIQNIFPPMVRSKTIVRPEHVLIAGIHFTHYHRGKANFTAVSNKLAIVHHYKGGENAKILDMTALRFKRKLLTHMKATLSLIR